MMQLGNLKIHFINDADVWVDPGGAFGLVPRALWQRILSPNEHQLVPMIQTCLYVETPGHKIVIDTGLGYRLGSKLERQWGLSRPRGGLVEALGRLGVVPDEIDLLINTHLHADHCSGNTRLDESGQVVATFPNAEYVVQRREFEDAMSPNERTRATYLADNFEPLRKSGRLRLLEGDQTLAEGITGIVAPGHTPGHMAIRFEGGGKAAAYVCDLASYAVHFEKLGWMTAYDVEPLITLETKRRWQRWALETDATIVFPHDPNMPAARLTQDERGRPKLLPVDISFT